MLAAYSAAGGDHPHEDALGRIAKAGAVILGTDVFGTVVVVTDGYVLRADADGFQAVWDALSQIH